MKKILLVLIIGIFSSMNILAEDFVPVVNKANQSSISKSKLKRILLGKIKKWESGQKVVIVNLGISDPAFGSLLKNLTGKDAVSFKEHWAKMQIRGKGIAPMIQGGTDGAKVLVGNIPGGITFVEKSKVGGNVIELQIK